VRVTSFPGAIASYVSIARDDVAQNPMPPRFRTHDGAPWKTGTSGGLRAIQDALGSWREIDLSFGDLRPSHCGAVGDGVTLDDTAMALFFTTCETERIPIVLDPGKVYRVSSTFNAKIRTPFYGNGSWFVVPNNGQTNTVFDVYYFDEDLTTYTLAEVNAWTGVKQGSMKVPQLGPGLCVTLGTPDKVFCPRGDGSGGLYLGETFETAWDDGSMADCLYEAWPGFPLTAVSIAQSVKVREQLVIDGLRIHYDTGSGTSNKAVRTVRPYTTFKNCEIYVASADIQQGFVVQNAIGTRFERCFIYGTGVTTTTNYGINHAYGRRTTIVDCDITNCRRAVDHHGGSDTEIYGGYYQGIGGHWVRNLRVYGATISQSPQTGVCVACSGSDYSSYGTTYNVFAIPTASTIKTLFNIRSDYPEFDGAITIDGGEINIYDDVTNGSVVFKLISTIDLVTFDYGRALEHPKFINFTPSIVRQRGPGDSNIYIIEAGANKINANVPNAVNVGGRINIAPGAVILDGPETRAGGEPKLVLSFIRGEGQGGDYRQVEISGMSVPIHVFAAPVSAAVGGGVGRYDIHVVDCKDATNVYHMRYGCVRQSGFTGCSPLATFSRIGAATAVGDEFQFPALLRSVSRTDTSGTINVEYGVDGTFINWNSSTVLTGNLTVVIKLPSATGIMEGARFLINAPGNLAGYTFTVTDGVSSRNLTANQTIDRQAYLSNLTWAIVGVYDT
jgi:hypothetical protein